MVLFFLGLVGALDPLDQQQRLSVGQDFTLRNDAFILVAGGVASQLQDLVCQVLQHGSQVHGGGGVQAFRGVTPVEEPAHEAHREMQVSRGKPGLALGAALAAHLKNSLPETRKQ